LPLTLAGKVHDHGIGTHAEETILINLHGAAQGFHAIAGVYDGQNLRLHKDVGPSDGSYSVVMPSHGTIVLKVGASR
jgi:hypothetical protein